MIDIHNHLLFGMDDGAKSIEESIALARLQESQGVDTIVVTPHFNPIKDDLNDFIFRRDTNLKKFRESLEESKVDISVLSGAEVYFSTELFEYDLKGLSIENTDYILIEFSTRTTPGNIVQQMNRIIGHGLIPIIAHIERYPFLKEDLTAMVDLVNLGVLFQVNGDTFINREQKNFIKACVKHNLVHLVATDSHSLDKRKPNLENAIKMLNKDYGFDFSNYLLSNAEKIVKNEDVDVYVPTKIQKVFGRFV